MPGRSLVWIRSFWATTMAMERELLDVDPFVEAITTNLHSRSDINQDEIVTGWMLIHSSICCQAKKFAGLSRCRGQQADGYRPGELPLFIWNPDLPCPDQGG